MNQCVALIQLDTDEASAGAVPNVEPEWDAGPPATYNITKDYYFVKKVFTYILTLNKRSHFSTAFLSDQ